LVEPVGVAEKASLICVDLREEGRDGESEGDVSVEEGFDCGIEEGLELFEIVGRK